MAGRLNKLIKINVTARTINRFIKINATVGTISALIKINVTVGSQINMICHPNEVANFESIVVIQNDRVFKFSIGIA